MWTAQNTWKEIEDAKVRVAVVPIGATEQHGTHLPLTTDTLIAEKFAQVVAEKLGAYLTPAIPIGQSAMWLEFPGSLSLSAETMKAVIADIVESLVKTGFDTILFISVHGGNEIVYRGFPESLQPKYPGIKILTIGYPAWVRPNWATIWQQAVKEAGLPEMIHADEAETSLVLALWPDLVGPHPTDCPLPANQYPPGKTLRQVYPSGTMGYGSRASKEKGARLWATVLRLAWDDLQKQYPDLIKSEADKSR